MKYVDRLVPLPERLHHVGTERDRAGNRSLHSDHSGLLLPLDFFNPIVKSLRGVQQASELRNVRRKLGGPRTSLGSLSASVTVVEPERPRDIVAELGTNARPSLETPGSGTSATP